MMRAGLMVLALLAAAGASPAPSLPVPPIPPAHPPLDQSAPMPDPDLRAPAAADPQGAQVSLSNFRYRQYDQSLGYAPGSHFQSSEEKRVIQTPGLTVRVPLQ
jgi:hypothetical protein